MARRTQLTLGQITGSFVDIKAEAIQYATPQTALGLTGSDIQDVVGALAAAVHRIHGKGSTEIFQNTAGSFYQGLKIESADGLIIGTGANEFSITESSDDVTIKTLVSDKDLIFKVNDGGEDTEVFRLDGDVSSLLVAGNKKITFNDAGTLLHSPADGKLLLQADGAAADAIVIDASGNAGIDITVGNAANDSNASLDIVAMNKVTIDAQGTDAGDGVEITLGTDNGNARFMVLNNSETPQFMVQADGTTTIAGDLIVQGATTTISSSNTVFKDNIIGLGVSGSLSEDHTNVGDRAIIFARAAAAYSFLPAINYDGTNSEFEFATFSASPSSGAMGAPQAGIPLKTGHLKPITDDGATLGDANERWSDLFLADGGVINFDNANVSLTHSSNALTISANDKLQFRDANSFIHSNAANDLLLGATDITVDANADIILDANSKNIILKDNGVVRGSIQLEAALTISSSAGANLILDSNSGNFILHQDAEVLGSFESNTGLVISSSGGGALKLDTNSGDVEFHQAATKFFSIENNSGNTQLKAAVNDADILFLQDDGVEVVRVDGSAQTFAFPQNNAAGNASNKGMLTFNGVTDVNEAIYGDGGALYLRSNAVNFKLPTADGNAGEVLETNGSGELSFVQQGADLARFAFAITQTIASGTTANFGDPKTAGVSVLSGSSSAPDFEITIADADVAKKIEVFVNGQLLVSGANGDVGTSAVDYAIKVGTNNQIDFAFGLEVDDVIQIIQR
jgi:hypothetical protein